MEAQAAHAEIVPVAQRRWCDACVGDRDAATSGVARSIVGTVFSVANGSAFWRKSSYLVGREGTLVASPLVDPNASLLVGVLNWRAALAHG